MAYRGILKEHSSILSLMLRLLDALAIFSAGLLAHYFYLDAWVTPQNYIQAMSVAVIAAAWLFSQFDLYRTWRGASLVEEVRSITLAWLSVLLILFAFAFAMKMGQNFSRGWAGSWAVLGLICLVSFRVILRSVLRWIRRKGLNRRRIVIVGATDLGYEVAKRLERSPWTGLQLMGFFCDAKREVDASDGAGPILGGLSDIGAYVADHTIDQVWITMPLKDEDKVRAVLDELRHAMVDIRFVPNIFGFRLLNHSVTEVAGLPVLNLSATPMHGVNRMVKAMEDRLLALVILLLISPIMLLLAVAVKLSSRGPVFYRQERIGWNGEAFNMLKFRSMPVDVEKDGVSWGGAQNKTLTRFGAFIRKTSLDELPQFLNVLKGDMSIVGPRPERAVFVEQFKEEIPGYMQKHLVKAGITGWAQINGWRGDTDLKKRIEYDLFYIENWSVWFDLKIIVMTFVKGFFDKHAR